MATYEEFMNEEEEPVIFVHTDGTIININIPFAQTYHWSPDDLIGQPLIKIIPSGFQGAHNMGFSRFVLTGKSNLLGTPIDLEIELGNGKSVLAQHLIVSLENDGKQILAAKITPRSE